MIMKYILVINSGSATLKFKVFESGSLEELMSGIVERIGLGGSFVELLFSNSREWWNSFRIKKHKIKESCAVKNHEEALKVVLGKISDFGFRISDFSIVGHRVVHGGEEFTKPTVITPATLKKIEKYSKLSPLHNPVNLSGIKACLKYLPKARNIAVFDTAFYSTLPDYAYTYAIPRVFYKKYGIRRYGFHGISHQYVAGAAARILKKPLLKLNLITCHLGSGASITAIRAGKAVDTSMGFTPLEGLVMSTRSGDLDPAIPLYLINELKINLREADEILNQKSGLLGISGSADMREVLTAAGYRVPEFSGKRIDKKLAGLALKIFVYRVQKYIGAYAGILGKVDAIVFTGGIGERNQTIRSLIVKNFKIAGRPKILAIPTNEELMIAREIKRIG
jgi:acetate kinase